MTAYTIIIEKADGNYAVHRPDVEGCGMIGAIYIGERRLQT